MKKVLSVSLGSSARDHVVQANFMGEAFEVTRRGTDGNFDAAVKLYEEFDGKVDAFGVGGIEFYLSMGDTRWYWRDAKRIRAAVKVSKVGDGNGVKAILAARAVAALDRYLQSHEGKSLRGLKALKTTVTDRYGMAVALLDAGCDCTFGDFMFALGVPLPLHSLAAVRAFATVMCPVVTRLPYAWVYTLGEEQDRAPVEKWNRFYQAADIIAGDFHQIRSAMPSRMNGKIVLTNTTTRADVADLKARGVHLLVTTTPRLDGRSFGTNVIEALLLSLMNKPQSEVQPADFKKLIESIPIEPAIEVLNP